MLNEIESYILGFVQTDGHMRKIGNYLGLSIELSLKDKNILEKIDNYLNNSGSIRCRTRNTNFKKKYSSISYLFKNKQFVAKLAPYIPVGRKSLLIESPKNIEYSKKDYWRGIFDGDGSLGMKKLGNIPFISLVTGSEQLYVDIKTYIEEQYGFTLSLHRNKRDNIYNVTLLGPLAYSFVNDIYENANIAVDRKILMANKIINFDYQSNIDNKYHLTLEDDIYLIGHSKKQIKEHYSDFNMCSIFGRRCQLLKLKKLGLLKL